MGGKTSNKSQSRAMSVFIINYHIALLGGVAVFKEDAYVGREKVCE